MSTSSAWNLEPGRKANYRTKIKMASKVINKVFTLIAR